MLSLFQKFKNFVPQDIILTYDPTHDNLDLQPHPPMTLLRMCHLDIYNFQS